MSIFYTLLSHKQQVQQQSTATMPSKPAVTRKCQCFEISAPLPSACEGCISCRARVQLCARQRSSSSGTPPTISIILYYAHPRSREESAKGTPCTSQNNNSACSLVALCQPPPPLPPQHHTTSATTDCTASLSLKSRSSTSSSRSLVGKSLPLQLMEIFKKKDRRTCNYY